MRSPGSTGVFVCDTRTVERMKTGTSKRSDTSYASRVKRKASAESAGSSMGMWAARAYQWESCSFWDEYMPGSSAASTTSPPSTPAYAAVNNGSAATFTPTCFIVDSTRAPATDAPMPTSMATFSLTHHSAYTPSFFANASSVSVDGVPG